MNKPVTLLLFIVGLFVSAQNLYASTNNLEAGRVALSPQEREWISKHPVMRIGVLTNCAPFSYLLPDGTWAGIDIDVLNLVSQRTGLRFEPVPQVSWESLVSNWHELDMASSVVQTPPREQLVEFTKEYFTAPVVIVQREGDRTFGTAAILRHKTLAMPRKHLLTQKVGTLVPSAHVVFAATQDECFELVANKQADATIVNLLIASQYLNSHPDSKLDIGGVVAKSNLPLRMAVHRDPEHQPVVAILDKGLASISQDELEDIFAKHLLFGLQSRERVALLQKRARQILIPLAVIAVVATWWNFSMRREIRARREVEAELREANKSMQVFSQSLSHDLRAPLRGISGFARALKEDYYDKLGPEARAYLERIITSGAHMDKMITDVLAYSRATNSEWPMETVELNPLLHQLVEEFPPEQRGFFGVDFHLPAVRGHPTLLSQSLGNLLANAVQYVPKDRTPHVAIRAAREGSEVTIAVEDNGFGIAPEDQKRIFDIFERAAPAGYKGTGIGLAVVAKAVERMGGSVGVHSAVGKGSQFWIRLRGVTSEQPAREPKTQSVPFWRRFRAV